MKKNIALLIAMICLSCNNSKQITITKLKGSPSYEKSKLNIQNISFDEKGYNFSFGVEGYIL